MNKQEDQIELAWANYHAGEFEKVIELLGEGELFDERLKLRGLAFFQLGNFFKALEALTLFAKQTDTSLDWFSVSTSAAMAGKPDLALEAFSKCKEKFEDAKVEQSLSLALLHWYFLKAMENAGFANRLAVQLGYLADAFGTAKITDTQYLATRGLPDWDAFLEVLWPVLDALPQAQADAILAHLKKEVDQSGKNSLQRPKL